MPNVKDIPNVTFDHPIEVQLANYPCKHRVLAVKRAKNPNGIGRGKHSYAVAEWFIGGKWKPVRDLVSQMRLANAVEHELGHNPEKYANFEGDASLGEMRFDFRIVYHAPTGKTYFRFPDTSDDDSPTVLSAQLDDLVNTGQATGGHIEQYVDGIGWCIQTPEEDEA